MPYATGNDVAAFTGIPLEQLPGDVERLISRASEVIDAATIGRIDATEHAEPAKNAVAAQIEYWINAGEQTDIGGSVKNYSVGSFSIDYGDDEMPKLAPRARRILFLSGLLNRGVRRL